MLPAVRRSAAWLVLRLGACALATASAACSATGAARAPAIDRVELVKSATFDHGCPAEQIHVVDVDNDVAGTSSYIVDVCGTRHVYQRVGTMYFDAQRARDPKRGG